MPCMMNGKPVPGIKGQCPMGSTWSENNMVNLVRSQEDRITQDYLEEDKTAYKKEKAEGSMFSKMMDLINTDTQNQTKGNKELIKLMEKNGVLNPTPSSMMAAGSDSGRRGKATLDPQHKSRHGGTFEPTKMQTLMKNMKNPEWWSESISGLPSDTRLMRLGQLMNYYGKTPKGRDASDDPSKLWAQNEKDALKVRADLAAANNKTNPTFLAKMNAEDQDLAIRETIMDKLGFNDFIPFNQASDTDLEQTVAMVKGLIQQYVQEGDDWSTAYSKAMAQVSK